VNQDRLEIANIFHRHGEEFLKQWGHTVSPQQRKALRDIAICRTATLGGHIEQCDFCEHRIVAYNSCRNRHCPKCQSSARDRWLAERAKELLPVPYCHVVFTLPERLARLALQNQRLFYGLLFRAVSQTLLEIAADPQRLGAHIGFLAVLHTWSQNLLFHPHIHCLVPAGGIALDGSGWVRCRPNFFLPVRVLSCRFRRRLLILLQEAYGHGKVQFSGQLADLSDAAHFQRWLQTVKRSDWVVYAKPPFGGPEHVLKYLARYTHRVAISNGRLLRLHQGQVSFRWRDSKDHNHIKMMTLTATEFIRRFLLHVLPSGFVKIRYFGFLANRNRAARLSLCRQLLNAPPPTQAPTRLLTDEQERAAQRRCPLCWVGTLCIVEWFLAERCYGNAESRRPVCQIDSS